MKQIIALTIIIIISSQCVAQINEDKAFYAMKAEKYGRLKSTGRTLTILGGVMIVGGLVAISNAPTRQTYNSSGYYTTTSTGSSAVAGAVLYIFGNLSVGAGIPLWIVGKNNERKYVRKLEGISLGLNVNQQSTGLSLRYRLD